MSGVLPPDVGDPDGGGHLDDAHPPLPGTVDPGLRRAALGQLVAAVAASPWRDRMVLRGSVTLPAWIGEAAREPDDIEVVLLPPDPAPDGVEARRLQDDVLEAVRTRTWAPVGTGAVVLDPDAVRVRRPTLARAGGAPEGCRLVIPWAADGVPAGAVALDVAFGVELPQPPVAVELTLGEDSATVWSAAPTSTLAWTLLHLHTDERPRGHDLYDAVQLAERTPLPRGLLRHVVATGAGRPAGLAADDVRRWDVDWESFRREYPLVGGTAADWQERLVRALGPALEELA